MRLRNAWTMPHTVDEVFTAAQEAHVFALMLLRPEQVAENQPLASRDFFREQRHPKPGPLQVGSSGIYPRTSFLTPVDRLCNVDLTVSTNIAAGPHRRNAASQIQARETLLKIRVMARTSRIEQVLVHHHEPRDYGPASQIEYPGIARHMHGSSVTNL